jgi:hypothetical protein
MTFCSACGHPYSGGPASPTPDVTAGPDDAFVAVAPPPVAESGDPHIRPDTEPVNLVKGPPSALSVDLVKPPPSALPVDPFGQPAARVPRTGRRRRRTSLLLLGLVLVVGVGGTLGMLALGLDDSASNSSTTRASGDGPLATQSSDSEPTETTFPTESSIPTASSSPTNTSTPPEVAAGPLAVGVPYVNQPCTSEFIIMLATSGDRDEWESKLSAEVAGVSGAKYLKGKESCDAFIGRSPYTHDDVYNAYTGPYPTLADACSALDGLASEVAWTRQLANPSQERSLCLCATTVSSLPVITGRDSVDPGDLRVRRAISQVQWILYKMGINPSRDAIYGNYTDTFHAQIQQFQVQAGLVEHASDGGRIGELTWTALRDEYCGNPAYLETR